MKQNLIIQICTSRKRIDQLAINLGLSKIGSREQVIQKIKEQSFSAIKNTSKLIK